MPFSITELRVLAGLSQGRTLSAIAEQLNFSQPAMSKVLRAAESHAGMALVEHRGRRVHLTSAGTEVARTARTVLAQLGRLDQLVEDLHEGKRGTLRLAASMTPANYVLPPVIADFKTMYPSVELSLQVVSVGEWHVVLNQGLDLGIGTHGATPAGWVTEQLYRDPVVFFVPPDSKLASRESVPPEELAVEMVIAPWSRAFWTRILAELTTMGIELRRQMDIWPMRGVKQLVEHGHGIGVLLRSALAHDLEQQRFVALSVSGLDLAEPFYLIRPDVSHPPTNVEAFSRCLRTYVASRFSVDQ